MGTLISCFFKPLKYVVVSIVFCILILTLGTYIAFILGWWIPIIPAIIALLAGVITQIIIITKHSEKIQLNQIVQMIIKFAQEQPVAGQIAIEYLKQSESQENQIFIDKILKNSNF